MSTIALTSGIFFPQLSLHHVDRNWIVEGVHLFLKKEISEFLRNFFYCKFLCIIAHSLYSEIGTKFKFLLSKLKC